MLVCSIFWWLHLLQKSYKRAWSWSHSRTPQCPQQSRLGQPAAPHVLSAYPQLWPSQGRSHPSPTSVHRQSQSVCNPPHESPSAQPAASTPTESAVWPKQPKQTNSGDGWRNENSTPWPPSVLPVQPASQWYATTPSCSIYQSDAPTLSSRTIHACLSSRNAYGTRDELAPELWGQLSTSLVWSLFWQVSITTWLNFVRIPDTKDLFTVFEHAVTPIFWLMSRELTGTWLAYWTALGSYQDGHMCLPLGTKFIFIVYLNQIISCLII